MINKVQIKIYRANHGDNSWLSEKDRLIIDHRTWCLIDNLLEQIWLIRNDPTSEEIKVKIERDIARSCEDADTLQTLYDLSNRRWVRSVVDKKYVPTKSWWKLW